MRDGAANLDVGQFLAAELNSMVLVRALPSLPLVETMKRLSLESRAMSEIVSPENGE